MNSRHDRDFVLAGSSAVISRSKTASYNSDTTRIQTDEPFGGAALNRVSTLPVVVEKQAPMSFGVGDPVLSFSTNSKKVSVLR